MSKFFKQKISSILILFFFRAFSAALLFPVLVIYIKQIVHTDANTSLVLTLSYLLAIPSNIFSSQIIRHFQKKKALLLSLVFLAVTLFLFTLFTHVAYLVLIFGLYTFFLTLLNFNLTLYVRHVSTKKNLASNEGIAGAINNIGWMIGPILGGYLGQQFGVQWVFLLSGVTILAALFLIKGVSLFKEDFLIPDRKIKFYKPIPFFAIIRKFLTNTDLIRAYFNSFGLRFLYAGWGLMPLFLQELGMEMRVIGLLSGTIALPWVILEYPIGWKADKIGEKKFIVPGFLGVSLLTFLFGFAKSGWILGILWFIGVIFTTFIEMTSESYAFRILKEKGVEMVSLYRTADSLPYAIAPFIAFLVLRFFPLPIWFIVLGGLMILFFINSLSLIGNKTRK